ncbi:hypothetical protein GCM10009610_26530 [Pseudonocardia xinjiangensis]
MSAREVVDAHLARIDEVNTVVNAVTNLLADDARTPQAASTALAGQESLSARWPGCRSP